MSRSKNKIPSVATNMASERNDGGSVTPYSGTHLFAAHYSSLVLDEYNYAHSHGYACDVILVLDCNDIHGNELARALWGDDRIMAMISVFRSCPIPIFYPILVHAVSLDEAEMLVLPLFPDLKDSFLKKAPEGLIQIVAVTGDGSIHGFVSMK